MLADRPVPRSARNEAVRKMMRPVYAKVRDLPEPIQRVLREVRYGRPDIAVEPREKVSRANMGGDGRKGFVAVVDMATGQSKIEWGSWGGPNMFNPHNAVDLDRTLYAIPPNVAVIEGSIGAKTYATVSVRPDAMAPLLPAATDLTEKEKTILTQFARFTSAGRKNEWERYPETRPYEFELKSLAERGLLKRAKNGATAITTEGRNAIPGWRADP